MDDLKIALALIQEAEAEKKRLADMEAEIRRIPRGSDYWIVRDEIEARYKPTPRKAHINDNIKMARRLLARAYV
jgi:hypothetical protein